MIKRKTTNRGSGKSNRQEVLLTELFKIFPDEATSEKWFEDLRWGDKIECPRCGSEQITERKSRKPQPFRCKPCRRTFSVRIGTQMESSRLPLQKWAIAIYLYSINLGVVSSMKLHRDLKITQKSAWFMLQRLRDAVGDSVGQLKGADEVDKIFDDESKKINDANN